MADRRLSVTKLPGVYIVEKRTVPASVAAVATAIPAFVGYTERAARSDGESLLMKPHRINSLAEYEQVFGGAPHPVFEIAKADLGEPPAFEHAGIAYALRAARGRFNLHYGLRQFFENGGGPCFVVSVGPYEHTSENEGEPTAPEIDPAQLMAGIDALLDEREPTMLVVPDAVLLPAAADCFNVQRKMIDHCGMVMRNRIAILDVYDGDKPLSDGAVASFREAIAVDHLDFAVAYYPFLHATVVGDDEIGAESIVAADSAASSPELSGRAREAIRDRLNVLPPSAAIAGVYARVDAALGVWKAPANVALTGVVDTTVNLTAVDQEALNVTPSGKSINAIREFSGRGVLVWGARTLDGNSFDWRYVSVRRTAIMIEQSCRIAIAAYVFEPNAIATWVAVRTTIESFLLDLWKNGCLVGAKPEEAFAVRVGLGETMTANDLDEGMLRVSLLLAVSRPAEFIELTIVQKMQSA